jgi:hypothetical protein
MALSDGAHAYVHPIFHTAFIYDSRIRDKKLTFLSSSIEDYSYFTLRRAATSTHPATSLFGISCTRQLDASQLIDRPADVTRSTVQKAVVVISDRPQCFGAIKAQLGVVVAAWFAQKDFTDIEILQRFQESLPQLLRNQEGQSDQDFGRSKHVTW